MAVVNSQVIINWGLLKVYLDEVSNRSEKFNDWALKVAKPMLVDYQRTIWSTYGRVDPSSPVYWPEWGARYGKSGVSRHQVTGLTSMRMQVRQAAGTWSGRKTDILRETDAMKNSIGMNLISWSGLRWGVSESQQSKALDLDQMWNVEKGNFSITKSVRVPTIRNSKAKFVSRGGRRSQNRASMSSSGSTESGKWTSIQIPARPFVFFTKDMTNKLAESLTAFVFDRSSSGSPVIPPHQFSSSTGAATSISFSGLMNPNG